MNVATSHGQLLIDTIRRRPEFGVFADIHVSVGDIRAEFEITPDFAVILGVPALAVPAWLPLYLRQALEMAYLHRLGLDLALAGLLAARASSLFALAAQDELPPSARMDLPPWVAIMARDLAPSAAALGAVAAALPGGPAKTDQIAAIRAFWGLLGTAEALMETGGDIRLQRDPRSALNGYGCSHRPRPWAITFASSTASSSSERGYEAADTARLGITAALFQSGRRAAIAAALADVTKSIARVFGLDGKTQVILAASGTDTELLALALTHLAPEPLPILNILIASDETGRGVPMAARGRHFAVDTARGVAVNFEAPIAGFRADTELANVNLRDASGAIRNAGDVEAEIFDLIAARLDAGRRVILHALDLSKTGLLAPHPAFLKTLRDRFGDRLDIVVDACQTRLSAASIKNYLSLDAVVLITGSKFFTGPPFAGAALVPGKVATRLIAGRLPEGLEAYFGRDEFPEICPAAEYLPASGNYGLALRWHAALAEMRAFYRVKPKRRAEIIAGFGAVVAREIAANPALQLLPQPDLARVQTDEPWERLPSIFSFSVTAPQAPGYHTRGSQTQSRYLTPVEARAVYLWLNTDLSPWLPQASEIAGRICHIGQPVKLPQNGIDGGQGVLRISAGARLISGEPAHQGLSFKTRLRREMDDLAMVFKKIDLILRNWALLWAVNPAPRYRPEAMVSPPPHEIVINEDQGFSKNFA